MGIIDSISLFAIMITLAIIPSSSVALVITRSATLGLSNGTAVALGIVLGDLVFIFLALLGLTAIAETMGAFFVVIRYLAAAYLLWLGYTLLTAKTGTEIVIKPANTKGNLISSFVAGFLLTLGDVKAIFFYVSLLPTFMDLSALNFMDIFIIITITVVSVGGAKIAYALFAQKAAGLSKSLKFENSVKKTAGSLMIGAGGYLIIKT